MERTFGGIQTRLLGVVAELGVADVLAERPRSAREVAEALGTEPDATDRVLRYLASNGLLRRSRRGTYSNNRYSELLRSGTDDSLRDWVRFIGSDWMGGIVLAADRTVSTGESGARATTGREFFDHLTKADPAARETFDSAMHALGTLIAPTVLAAYDFASAARICDVGGGVGTTLAHVLAANPGSKGVLFDLPEVVADAGKPFEDLSVTDRVETVAGSFFDAVPENCDLYYLQAILHDWGHDDCLRILGNVTDAMAPGARIVVADAILEPGAPDDFRFGADMIMLLSTGTGRERTEEEWRDLFGAARLREVSRRTLPTLSTLFELVPRR